MTQVSVEAKPSSVPLTALRKGDSAIVRSAALEASDAAYVRALGLRADRRVRICRHGSPCIVEVACGAGTCCRVALSPALAAGVRVEPVRA